MVFSDSSPSVRRPPQQARSEKRFSNYLQIASDLFDEVGYEAATMTMIAQRSGASIGGLYHHFPDKESIAYALLERDAERLEREWKLILIQAPALTNRKFAELLTERLIHLVQQNPTHLTLLAVPFKDDRHREARDRLLFQVSRALRTKNPSLSEARSFQSASFAIEILKGIKNLLAEADNRGRLAIEADLRAILAFYFDGALSE